MLTAIALACGCVGLLTGALMGASRRAEDAARVERAERALLVAKRFMLRAIAAGSWGGDLRAECSRGLESIEAALGGDEA